MKKFKTIYVCDNCGYENENPEMFREIFGNIQIPTIEMIVGNNIWIKTEIPESIQQAIQQEIMPICHNSNDTVVTGMTFCLKCYIKMALKSYDSKNQAANAELNKQEREILTLILSEISSKSVKASNKKEIKTDAIINNEATNFEGTDITLSQNMNDIGIGKEVSNPE